MKDPRFAETVILLIEYAETGAVGLIINRPAPISLAQVLPGLKPGKRSTEKVGIGGPVDLNTLLMLIRAKEQPRGTMHVFGDVYVSSARDLFPGMAEDYDNINKLRLYAGYAGWAPGQLDKEMLRGDWYVSDGSPDLIFGIRTEDIWPALMRGLNR